MDFLDYTLDEALPKRPAPYMLPFVAVLTGDLHMDEVLRSCAMVALEQLPPDEDHLQ